jgi:hypothetical protein
MAASAEITPASPAITVTFRDGVYHVTREGKGDTLRFQRTPLIRHGWTPVTGTSLNGQVTLWWDWSNDLAWFEDRLGRTSALAGISETVEEMAFMYLS